MKTYQFVEKVKELGYEIKPYYSLYSRINIFKDDEEIVNVDPAMRYHLFKWAKEEHSELMELVIEYIRTPVAERKYSHPDYIEHEGEAYFVGRRYNMARHGEHVIARLCFGDNKPDDQPTHRQQGGLRGAAAMFTAVGIPDNFGFYWVCEPTDNYLERTLAFKDLIASTWLEDNPFDGAEKPHQKLFSEVVEV